VATSGACRGVLRYGSAKSLPPAFPIRVRTTTTLAEQPSVGSTRDLATFALGKRSAFLRVLILTHGAPFPISR